jgi:hypothetical protein
MNPYTKIAIARIDGVTRATESKVSLLIRMIPSLTRFHLIIHEKTNLENLDKPSKIKMGGEKPLPLLQY